MFNFGSDPVHIFLIQDLFRIWTGPVHAALSPIVLGWFHTEVEKHCGRKWGKGFPLSFPTGKKRGSVSDHPSVKRYLHYNKPEATLHSNENWSTPLKIPLPISNPSPLSHPGTPFFKADQGKINIDLMRNNNNKKSSGLEQVGPTYV